MKYLEETIKLPVALLYDFIDMLRYVFLRDRRGLDRPVFLYHDKVRSFVRKYGQHNDHLSYQTKDKQEQLDFLKEYGNYIYHVSGRQYDELQKYDKDAKSPTIRFGSCIVWFDEKGELVYWYKKENGHGGGYLGMSFEMNINYY